MHTKGTKSVVTTFLKRKLQTLVLSLVNSTKYRMKNCYQLFKSIGKPYTSDLYLQFLIIWMLKLGESWFETSLGKSSQDPHLNSKKLGMWYVIPAVLGSIKQEDQSPGQSLQTERKRETERPDLQNNQSKRAGGIAQGIG